jgi:hypothetical protein
MWRCVDPAVTDVSEGRIASIFRVEKSASGEPASAASKKTKLFIVTAVKTSDLTNRNRFGGRGLGVFKCIWPAFVQFDSGRP